MKRAFTILEMITVVAVLTLIISLVLPAVFMVRESSRLTKCQNNLRQLGMELIQGTLTNKFLPENRFVLTDQGIAVSESLWTAKFLQDTKKGDGRMERTPAYWICPSGLGVHEFPTSTTLLNHSPPIPLSDYTCDYVANGGLASPRSIRKPLLSSRERGGIATDVFQEHPKRNMASIAGGMTHTICMWESIGGAAIEVQPITKHRFVEPWNSPIRGRLRSDVEPVRAVAMRNSETVSKYCLSINGRLVGYLALFDPYWEPLKDNAVFVMTHELLNVTNKLKGPFSFHTQTIPMVLMDGSVRSISVDVSREVIMNLARIIHNPTR